MREIVVAAKNELVAKKRKMNDEILNKISDNLLSDAIQLIKQKVGKLESIVLVEGQLAKHNSDVIAGVLSFEQETVSINRIRKKIIEIYNNYSSTFSNKPVLIFLDERDNHIYKAVKLTNKYWTTSNLSYEPKDSMWQNEFIKHRFQDNSFENYYSWKCAMNNIPQGWRIPSEKDWSDLIDYFGGHKKAINTGFLLTDIFINKTGLGDTGRNPREAFYSLMTEGKSGLNLDMLGGFNKKYSEKFRLYEVDEVGTYWSSTDINGDFCFGVSLYLSEKRVWKGQVDKENLFPTRLVKDL